MIRIHRRNFFKAMACSALSIAGCKEKVRPLQNRLETRAKIHLTNAICVVECGMWPDDMTAQDIMIIPRGKAGERGPFQLTRQYVEDVSRIFKEDIPFYEADDIAACRGMMMIYWDHYATPERIGHEPTMEDLARIHNGGPDGYKKESTKEYWYKVKKVLEDKNGSVS